MMNGTLNPVVKAEQVLRGPGGTAERPADAENTAEGKKDNARNKYHAAQARHTVLFIFPFTCRKSVSQ